LNARAAVEMAPAVARLAGSELDWNADRQRREVDAFSDLARGYMLA
jgi:glycerol-3-phosphate dehydrogenase